MSSESVDREKVATWHKLNKFFVSPESSKCLLKSLDNTATDRYNKILNVSTKYTSTKRLMHKVDGDLLCVVCKTIACFEEYEGIVSNDIIEIGSVFVGLKFIAMIMVAEAEAVLLL